jgi:methionine sulfoxide reductase heme-binding subunit
MRLLLFLKCSTLFMTKRDIQFSKLVVLTNSLIPLLLLLWDWSRGQLGANPLEYLTHTTGTLTLIFLCISLAVTPLRKAAGLPWLGQLRRMCGLFAFFYGSLHLLAYTWFDKLFALGVIVKDVAQRPFITLGMLSWLVMLPLALTSTNAMIKRLGGQRWNRLHKLAYVAAVAGVIHYYLLVKADITKPVAFGVVIAVLLAYRVANKFLPDWTQRQPARAAKT